MDENKKRGIVSGHATAKLRVESLLPPPPGFISPFKTLKEWLNYICDSQPPEKPVSEYWFQLYGSSSGENDLGFVGYTYTIEDEISSRNVSFKIENWFFPLPQKEFGNLSPQELKERLFNELKNFTETDKFQNSFLSDSDSISTNFGGEIW